MGIPGPEYIPLLRAAVGLSPDNAPLHQALGEALLSAGFAKEAVAEFRAALAIVPEDAHIKTGLARAFFADAKNSHALVVVEDVVRDSGAPAKAFVLHAKLLASGGEMGFATEQYKVGVGKDPTVADPNFESRLGLRVDFKPEPNPTPSFQPLVSNVEKELADDDALAGGQVPAASEPTHSESPLEVEHPKMSFENVVGMQALKEEIRLQIICPLTHAEVFKAYGRNAQGGVLLYGPPGCGKAHLARAVAGEVKAGYLAIGIQDLLDRWAGNGEHNLHAIFEQARRNAPCVLFFEDVETLGACRRDAKTGSRRHLINLFLSEVDAVKNSNEGVIILAATTAPWQLDSAFRRPGRFDRSLFVPPPDAKARAAILRLLLAGKPVDDVDYDTVATKCEGYSGADLKAVVNDVVEGKLREAMKSRVPLPIGMKDLLVRLGGQNTTTHEWFATAKNHSLYSNQEGAYDDVLKYLRTG